jgi:hypothetical protein
MTDIKREDAAPFKRILGLTGNRLHAQSIIANGAPAAGQNQFYSINPTTGIATSISPTSSSIVAGLAAQSSGQFLGLASNNLVTVNVTANTTAAIGPLGGGLSATGFDVLTDGRAFTVPTTSGQIRLHSVDLATGTATGIGSTTAIRDAVVAAGGPSSNPFMISLGSVGSALYGIDTNSSSLIALNPDTGAATVVGGAAGSISAGTLANGNSRSRYSGFSSLTGVDTNADGQYDTLFGGVNFFDDDNNPGTPTVRFGGVAMFSTSSGTWDLVGANNPTLIFFGMAAVPVPATIIASALGMFLLGRSVRNNRKNSSAEMETGSIAPL